MRPPPESVIRLALAGVVSGALLTLTIYCAPVPAGYTPPPSPEPRRAAPTFVSHQTDDPRYKCFTIRTETVISNPAFSCVYVP